MQRSLEKVSHVTERKLRRTTSTKNFSEVIIWLPQTDIHSTALLYLSHTKWVGRSKFPKSLCEVLFQTHGFWSSGLVLFLQYSADSSLLQSLWHSLLSIKHICQLGTSAVNILNSSLLFFPNLGNYDIFCLTHYSNILK